MKLIQLFRSLHHTAPKLSPVYLSANEKREIVRSWGARLSQGESFADLPILRVPLGGGDCIKALGRKLAYALRYREIGTPAPPNARAVGMWAQLHSPEADHLLGLGNAWMPNLVRGWRSNVEIGDQFAYRHEYKVDEDLFVHLTQMGNVLLLGAVISKPPREPPSELPWRALPDEAWRPGGRV